MPQGVTQIKTFEVFLDLQFEYVWACALAKLGFSIAPSVQSIIPIVFGKFWKHFGKVFLFSCLDGQHINDVKWFAKNGNHALRMTDAVLWEIENR